MAERGIGNRRAVPSGVRRSGRPCSLYCRWDYPRSRGIAVAIHSGPPIASDSAERKTDSPETSNTRFSESITTFTGDSDASISMILTSHPAMRSPSTGLWSTGAAVRPFGDTLR